MRAYSINIFFSVSLLLKLGLGEPIKMVMCTLGPIYLLLILTLIKTSYNMLLDIDIPFPTSYSMRWIKCHYEIVTLQSNDHSIQVIFFQSIKITLFIPSAIQSCSVLRLQQTEKHVFIWWIRDINWRLLFWGFLGLNLLITFVNFLIYKIWFF